MAELLIKFTGRQLSCERVYPAGNIHKPLQVTSSITGAMPVIGDYEQALAQGFSQW